jgi:transketolase
MSETTSDGASTTTIYCPNGLPEIWRQGLRGEPPPLANQWQQQYPELFDDDDLEHIKNQAHDGYHFSEWYAAIHLFQRDGSRSLVEKYDTYENHRLNQLRKKHRRKVAEYESAVPQAQRQVLHEICSELKVQLPDLLVLRADRTSFAFAEVKGAADSTVNREDQRGMRDAIWERLGVPVEVIKIRLWS